MSVLVPAALAAAAVAVLLSAGPGAGRVIRLLRPVGVEHPDRAGPDGADLDRAVPGRHVAPRGAAWLLGTGLPSVLAVTGLLVLGAGPVPALLGAVVAGGLVRWRGRRSAAAARADERARAVEACTALAAELRAGRSPAQALGIAAGLAAGPSRQALAAAAASAELGGEVAASLRNVRDSAVPEVLRSLAACWTVCSESGGGLAAAVERLELGLRATDEQRRAVQAELAGPRATAGMLAVLPLAGLVLAAGLGADPLHVLLHTPVGLLCLVLGVGLDGLGLFWTGRLVARAGGTG